MFDFTCGSCRLPEVTELWKDLLHHPQNLSPQFSGTTTCGLVLDPFMNIFMYLLLLIFVMLSFGSDVRDFQIHMYWTVNIFDITFFGNDS